MDGSKLKEKVTPHKNLKRKENWENQGKPVEEDEYCPGQPIMLKAGRGKGMKKTNKLWVIKELKMDRTIKVEDPYSRKTKVVKRALVQNHYPP